MTDRILAARPRYHDWRPGLPCACTARILHDSPEERTGHVVHGALVCLTVAEPDPADCRTCGAPSNNADGYPNGLCPLCRAGQE